MLGRGDDFFHINGIEIVVLHRPEDGGLHLDGQWIEGGLLEELDDAGAAVELGPGARVEIGAELRESGQFAELGKLALDLAGDLLGHLQLRVGADAGDGKTDGNGGADALVEEVSLQIDLAVGD